MSAPIEQHPAARAAVLRPLESDKLCACSHTRVHHISNLHVEIPCIVSRCGCMKFVPAAEVSI